MDTRLQLPRRQLTLHLFVCLAAVVITGCQSIATFPGHPKAEPTTGEELVVQVRPANSKARNQRVAVTADMTLQNVVDEVKTKFRNKIVYIVRTSPVTGERHKLEAQFESNRRISLHTDYAIQPGDRVVISQDTTSSFDRVMKSMFGRS